MLVSWADTKLPRGGDIMKDKTQTILELKVFCAVSWMWKNKKRKDAGLYSFLKISMKKNKNKQTNRQINK